MILNAMITLSIYAGALLTPLFLQSVQHVSALDAGLILLLPSLAMALCMAIVGKLYNLMDPRILVVIGIIGMALGSFKMSQLTLETTHAYITTWMTFRNVGMALATMPVTNMGMSCLDRKLSGSGSSVNSWISQSMGALSIGVFTSLVTFLTKQHAAELMRTDVSKTMEEAFVQSKAFVMGINDVYFVAFIIILITFPLSLLLKKEISTEKTHIIKDSEDSQNIV
jgi:MFS family permease